MLFVSAREAQNSGPQQSRSRRCCPLGLLWPYRPSIHGRPLCSRPMISPRGSSSSLRHCGTYSGSKRTGSPNTAVTTARTPEYAQRAVRCPRGESYGTKWQPGPGGTSLPAGARPTAGASTARRPCPTRRSRYGGPAESACENSHPGRGPEPLDRQVECRPEGLVDSFLLCSLEISAVAIQALLTDCPDLPAEDHASVGQWPARGKRDVLRETSGCLAAGQRNDDNNWTVLIRGVVRDDERRPSAALFRALSRAEINPVNLTAAREIGHPTRSPYSSGNVSKPAAISDSARL